MLINNIYLVQSNFQVEHDYKIITLVCHVYDYKNKIFILLITLES
jgi:hypothetical protein